MKLLHKTVDISLLIIIGFVVMVWYWVLYPYNPLEIKNPLPVVNENKTVEVEGLLIYRVEFKKNTDIKPVITRRLVDGIVFNFPDIKPLNDLGTHDHLTTLEIPHSIPPGNYILESTACYKMNPIREICVDYSTEEFTIIAKD